MTFRELESTLSMLTKQRITMAIQRLIYEEGSEISGVVVMHVMRYIA